MERKGYPAELKDLKSLILNMGDKTVTAVKLTTQALLENNAELAVQVRSLEKEIDLLYKESEERCIAFIATQQPMARDLRFIVSTIKIATEIERIADYANNIAKKVQKKFSQEDTTPIELLKPAVEAMAQEAVGMLSEAMQCYDTSDAERSMLVHERDKRVNRLNRDLFRNLVAMTIVNQYSNELAMNFHTIARYIERVADRSGNIAEFVYYEVTGYRFKEQEKNA